MNLYLTEDTLRLNPSVWKGRTCDNLTFADRRESAEFFMNPFTLSIDRQIIKPSGRDKMNVKPFSLAIFSTAHETAYSPELWYSVAQHPLSA